MRVGRANWRAKSALRVPDGEAEMGNSSWPVQLERKPAKEEPSTEQANE